MAFPYDWHKSLISDFANSILAGHKPRVTGLQALEVHRLIAAIEDSSRSGQKIKIVRK
jgi:predicted dehydrogenase